MAYDSVTGGSRRSLLLLMGAVGLLLIIACSNVASLALVRASGRIREMGVRTALGGGRARLIRQLLTESLFLAAGGGALDIAFTFASIRLLLRLDPGNIPRLDETSVDLRVLLFALVVSILNWFLVRNISSIIRFTLRSLRSFGSIGQQKRERRAESGSSGAKFINFVCHAIRSNNGSNLTLQPTPVGQRSL